MTCKSKTNGQRRHVPQKQTLIKTIRSLSLVKSFTNELTTIFFKKNQKMNISSRENHLTSNIPLRIIDNVIIAKPNKNRLKRNPS